MVFSYVLHEAGWATIRINSKTINFECTFSYLHDSLDQFCESVLKLLNRSGEASVSFMDEPGELLLKMQNDRLTGKVLIAGYWHKNTFASWNCGIEEFKEVFKFDIKLYTLSMNLIKILDDIYNEYGVNGYLKRWGMHPFPFENYMKLKHWAEAQNK